MALSTASFAAEEALPRVRPLGPADAPALARLMLDAFKGTIDDEGESLEDAVAEVSKAVGARPRPRLGVVERGELVVDLVLVSHGAWRPT